MASNQKTDLTYCKYYDKYLKKISSHVTGTIVAKRGRLTNEAIERDKNMTDQPIAQLTVGSPKERPRI
jgi:hypothetical protein